MRARDGSESYGEIAGMHGRATVGQCRNKFGLAGIGWRPTYGAAEEVDRAAAADFGRTDQSKVVVVLSATVQPAIGQD
jgi:hypothetical protein